MSPGNRLLSVTLAAVAIVSGLSPATAPTQAATRPVVVVLRDQLSADPPDSAHVGARRATAQDDQHAVLGALPGGAPAHVRDFAVGNAFATTVDAAQASALAANPAVAEVIPDEKVVLPGADRPARPVHAPVAPGRRASAPPATVCPADPAKPLLEPEALTSVHATGAQALATGAGVRVGYIADGIDPDNPDLVRADGRHVIVDSENFTGAPAADGTFGEEAFGDASSIAAQGLVTHDLSTYVSPAHPLPTGCDIRIEGVAPGADVVAIDAVDSHNATTISDLLQSIDYAVGVAHVDVLNESFGQNAFPDANARDAVELFNDQAVAAGVSVLVASGDAGPTSTIDTPAADPDVISVGASTDFGVYEQIGDAGAPLGSGGWLDDNISSFSSAGFTQGGSTIDLTAPGEEGWAACTASGLYSGCTDESGRPTAFRTFGGTSEATPIAAGTAALVIQAYRRAHGGRTPSPALVKQLLTGTAHDLGVPAQDQGAGLLDARAATEAALTYPGATGSAPTGVRSHLVLSTDRLTGTGTPGSSRTDHVDVTNTGTAPLTVTAGLHDYQDLAPATEHDVTLDPAKDPTYPGVDGTPQVYAKQTFTVDPGTDVLTVRAAWPGQATPMIGDADVVSVSLFDPAGRLAADTRPEGGTLSPNYGNMLVRTPRTGTWTALVTTGTDAPFTGLVRLGVTEQRARPVGHVSPSVFTLPPGGHRSVSVTSDYPTASGDTADTVTFGTSAGDTTAVPDVLRSLVPLTGGHGSFAGSITGGNGRGGAPAESFTYAFDVPEGAPGLNVATTLARDEGDVLEGVLIDPNGETPSVGTNYPIDQDIDPNRTDQSMTESVADPLPGRWRFVLWALNSVSGQQLTMPFTGTVSLHTGATVTTSGLPDSAGTVLAANTEHTAGVTVTNTSPETVYVQTDARTSAVTTIPLASRFLPGTPTDPSPPTIPLPMSTFGAMSFLVPPQTTSLTATDNSTLPSQVELVSVGVPGAWGGVDATGDLRAAQAGGTTSTATVAEAHGYVGQGDWLIGATEVGPFGPDGAPSGTATVGLTATTRGFDPTVVSTTGDAYAESTDASASLGTPVVLAPGASATIGLVITPTAAAGTVVHGTLNIVTPGDATEAARLVLDPVAPSGDVLASLPYAYTVGAPAGS